MTPLEQKLRRMIAEDGPVPISTYMALCLGDPEHGYYRTREAFGRGGDFITAPDVSQLFGELIAVALIVAAERLDRHSPVGLVEFGPGRGTLMADMLRTIRALRPTLYERLSVTMVETSARLRERQAASLANLAEPNFADDVHALPMDRPLLAVANEFFDALPVRQFVKLGGLWRERAVGIDAGGSLAFTTATATLPDSAFAFDAAHEPDSAIAEVAPAREAVMAEIAARLRDQGGFSLFIDYGHERSGAGDTFQAVRNHRFVPVLVEPGLADLSSHVDFAALASVCTGEGCQTAILTQGDMLLRLGLLERAGALGSGKPAEVQHSISAAVERLAGPDAMGTLFKVLAVAPSGPLPAPFDR